MLHNLHTLHALAGRHVVLKPCTTSGRPETLSGLLLAGERTQHRPRGLVNGARGTVRWLMIFS